MNLSTLKKVCASVLDKTTGDLTQDSVDLFLVAANNVRRSGELLHDFEYCRLTATIAIEGSDGVLLDSAVIEGNEGLASVVLTGVTNPVTAGTYVDIGTIFGSTLYYSDTTGYCIYKSTSPSQWNIALLTNVFTTGSTGAYWSSATLEGTYTAHSVTGTPLAVASTGSIFEGLKSVVAVMRQRPDGTWIPLDFARVDIPIERDRTELEFSDNLFPYLRYPSDAQINARGTTSSIVQRGRWIGIHPRFADATETTFSCQLEGYGWLSNYESLGGPTSEPQDFLLRYGHEWLQWAIVCELNYKFQKFVPRQEGVITAPEQKAEAAWQKLLLWDSYQVDANTTRSR